MFVRIAQTELLDDVMADALGGAGGKGGDRAVGEKFAEAAELAIFGAEVVAPLGDAMGFVNGEERDGDTAEPGRSAVGEPDPPWPNLRR